MFAQIKRRTLAVAVAALLVGMTANARADFVVAPNANANVEGDGNNGFPFNIQDFGISTMRYQQVYDSSQFSSLGGPKLITEIIFRPDAQSGQAFSSTLSSIQIDLSTTSAAPGGLSNTFANNVGADDKVVYGLGSLSLSSRIHRPGKRPQRLRHRHQSDHPVPLRSQQRELAHGRKELGGREYHPIRCGPKLLGD